MDGIEEADVEVNLDGKWAKVNCAGTELKSEDLVSLFEDTRFTVVAQ